MTRHLTALLAALLLVPPLHAAPPQFGSIFPSGGRAGTTFSITSTIKPTVDTGWWTSAPGVTFGKTDKPDVWTVTIPAETPIGLYPIVRTNAEGVSSTRWFSVGSFPEIQETEPNDGAAAAQPVSALPVCINARLGKANDTDHFRIPLEKGQTLVGLVEAYSLGSPVDVMAHLLGPDGVRLATITDARNLDPLITFTAPATGSYTLQLCGFAHPPQANVNYTGSPAVVYRLHLTTGPVVTHFHPFAVAPGQPTPVQLHGFNLDPASRTHTPGPQDLVKSGANTFAVLPHAITPLQPLITATAPAVEQEPNQEPAQATRITRGAVAGLIGDRADIDRYAIDLKKGDKLRVKARSTSLGLTLDPQLQVEGPDGKLVTEVDDFDGSPEPVARWTAATDGVHQIIVSDTLRQGGPHHHYVLEVSDQKAAVEATVADPKPVVLAPGASATVKVTLKKQAGVLPPLTLRAEGLPAGLTAPEIPIGEKDTEVEIKLTAAKDAPAGHHPLRLSVVASAPPAGGATPPPPFPATAVSLPLRGDTLRGTSLLDATDVLWASIVPPPPPAPAPPPPATAK